MNANKPSFYFSFSREDSFSSTEAQIIEGDSPSVRNAQKETAKSVSNEFQIHQNKTFKAKLKKFFCLE